MISNIIYEQTKISKILHQIKSYVQVNISRRNILFLNLIGIKTKRKSVKPFIKLSLPIFIIKIKRNISL